MKQFKDYLLRGAVLHALYRNTDFNTGVKSAKAVRKQLGRAGKLRHLIVQPPGNRLDAMFKLFRKISKK